MAFKDLVFATREVAVSGTTLTVRGLSFNDLSHLVKAYAPIMREMFTDLRGRAEDLTSEESTNFGMAVLDRAPEMAAAIIARAIGAPKEAAMIELLPFPEQMELLEAVAEMTFSTEGGAKKVLETVIRLAQGSTGLIQTLRN